MLGRAAPPTRAATANQWLCCWSHQTEGPIILLIGSFALEICLNQAFFNLECGAVKLAFIPSTAQLTIDQHYRKPFELTAA